MVESSSGVTAVRLLSCSSGYALRFLAFLRYLPLWIHQAIRWLVRLRCLVLRRLLSTVTFPTVRLLCVNPSGFHVYLIKWWVAGLLTAGFNCPVVLGTTEPTARRTFRFPGPLKYCHAQHSETKWFVSSRRWLLYHSAGRLLHRPPVCVNTSHSGVSIFSYAWLLSTVVCHYFQVPAFRLYSPLSESSPSPGDPSILPASSLTLSILVEKAWALFIFNPVHHLLWPWARFFPNSTVSFLKCLAACL